jgi:hypothetical protein
MSQLNIFERILSYVQRHIMQDRWTRNALVVYLCVVHWFAMLYVFQILSPELVEEVDQHLREKWSKETFALPEHPDI